MKKEKINNINQINADEIKEQLKLEFKDENDINSFLKAIDFDFDILEMCYLKGWCNGESDTNTSYKMSLINEKIGMHNIESYKLKEIIANDEIHKLKILESKGLRLVDKCNKIKRNTDISEVYGFKKKKRSKKTDICDDKLNIIDVLKDTYQYANELFVCLYFLGCENSMINYYFINDYNNTTFQVNDLEKLKIELCSNNSMYLELVINNLFRLSTILEQIDGIKRNYSDCEDYGSFGNVDVSTEKNAIDMISSFQKIISDLVEKLKIYLNIYLSRCENSDELKSKFNGMTIFDIHI